MAGPLRSRTGFLAQGRAHHDMSRPAAGPLHVDPVGFKRDSSASPYVGSFEELSDQQGYRV